MCFCEVGMMKYVAWTGLCIWEVGVGELECNDRRVTHVQKMGGQILIVIKRKDALMLCVTC